MRIALIILLSFLIAGCCIHFHFMKDCHDFRDCLKHPKPIQTF